MLTTCSMQYVLVLCSSPLWGMLTCASLFLLGCSRMPAIDVMILRLSFDVSWIMWIIMN